MDRSRVPEGPNESSPALQCGVGGKKSDASRRDDRRKGSVLGFLKRLQERNQGRSSLRDATTTVAPYPTLKCGATFNQFLRDDPSGPGALNRYGS